jgi:hypothetical protein
MQAQQLKPVLSLWSRAPCVAAIVLPRIPGAHRHLATVQFVNRLRLPPGGSFAFGTAADASENLKQSSGDGSWGGGRYSSKGSWSSAGGWVIALAGTASNVALCASDEVQAEKDAANAMLDTMWPLIEKLGWGSVMVRLPRSCSPNQSRRAA